MIYCPYCGTELPDDAIYCNRCGKKMPNINNENLRESESLIIQENTNQPPLPQDHESESQSISTPPPSSPGKKNTTKNTTKIVIGVFVAIIVCICGIGLVSLFTSSSDVSQENIIGTWKSTTAYYDDDSSQYSSVYYTFSPNGGGTQTWYDINGIEYSSRKIEWSGNNNAYTILEKDTGKKHTFAVDGDRASISYGINFIRTTDGAVATPIPTSPIYTSQKNTNRIVTSVPTKKPTATPTVLPTSAPTQQKEEYIKRNYNWEYNGYQFTSKFSFPKSTYDYYKSLGHGNSNLAKYATDSTNRKIVSQIADSITSETSKIGFDDYDKVMSVVSFVQSLPYTSDKVTTGHDEYPRYPIETLVDNGGDCEDTAILTAAILREMGYGCVLLKYPGHVAVGVKGGEGITGSYYTIDGDDYFYLETTGKNWDVGEIPDAYKSTKATIIKIN